MFFKAFLPSLLCANRIFAYIPAVPTNDTDVIDLPDTAHINMKYKASLSVNNVVAFLMGRLSSTGVDQGALVHFTENGLTDDTVTAPWIALVNCDMNATDSSPKNDIFTLARVRGATGALLYSETAEACDLTFPYADSDDPALDIFMSENSATTRALLSQFDNLSNASYSTYNPALLNENHASIMTSISSHNGSTSNFILATLRVPDDFFANDTDTNTTDTGPTNAGRTNNPNTGLAMIILYAITGCVSALFIVVILSGAIRAIRHPERYGPRTAGVNGRGLPISGQTRTGGLGRAILDTFPVVKFVQGQQEQVDSSPSNKDDAEHAAMELSSRSPSRNVNNKDEKTREGDTADEQVLKQAAAHSSSPQAHDVAMDMVHDPDLSAMGHETCPICIVDFEEGENVRVLPCEGKHRFHQICVDPWLLELSSSCPLCREDFHALESMLSGGIAHEETITEQAGRTHRFTRYLRFARRRRRNSISRPEQTSEEENRENTFAENLPSSQRLATNKFDLKRVPSFFRDHKGHCPFYTLTLFMPKLSNMVFELQRLFRYVMLFLYLLTSTGVVAQFPLIDFNRMGTVGLAGAFSGLDLANNSTFSFDPTTSTLLSRSTDGSLIPIASTNKGGQIIAGCSLEGDFYLAGSISSINGTSVNNVASYSPSTGSFSNLSGGLDGQVDALHCDQSTGQLWAGGAFQAPTSMSNGSQFKGSVAIFDVKQSKWLPAPFGGLRGASSKVQSIIPNSSGSSLYFTGSFIVDFKSNATVFNGTNNPNVPFSIGATAFSSSLVPIPLTPPGTQIDASPSTTLTGFSNISNILCPAGPDGSGNTWLAQDASTALITVQTFQFSTASGIRLGNTFIQNRGTTAFTAVTLPNNKPLTFNYVDPVTLRNLTCSASCPLGTNSSVLYQDFLFDGVSIDITGIQLTLTEWQGAGAGLHILQLLSSGAFASAVESVNKPSCFAPVDSTVELNGPWNQFEVPTSIAATTQPVLISNVSVGTSSANSPSVIWMPYVSAPGNYDINLLIPGCLGLGDCPTRTSVKVTVFPGVGLPSVTTTVRQDVQTDTTAAIYRGPVVPSSPDLQISIQMELADSPIGTGQNGQFQLIADRVQLVLISVNFSASASSSSDGFSLAGLDSGFGFFEWVLSDKSTIDATGVLPNSTETSADALGLQLFSILNLNSSENNSAIINAAATDSTGTIFVGGNFQTSSGMANIAIFKDDTLSPLANNGLNGAVTSLTVFDETLYVGGLFTDTVVSSGNGAFSGVVSYDIQNNKWMPLLAGVNGDVNNLNVANGRLDVAGNFTLIPTAPNSTDGFSTDGLASWDIQTGSWINPGGFLDGIMTLVSNGTTSGMEYVAGSVSVVRQFGSDGLIMISNGNQKTGEPVVAPLAVPLASEPHASSIPIPQRRSFASLRRRQASTGTSAIPTLNISSPAILAGAFWVNDTSSAETTIIGGQFATFSETTAQSNSLAFYDANKAVITGPRGEQVNGTVKALQVIDNTLYVGGQFTLSTGQANGFAIYDLAQQQWETSFQALQGSTVDVTTITTPSFESNMVVVGGTFSSAGSLPCQGICRFDTSAKQWNQLGSGIEGQVTIVQYTSNPNLLIAAGSIQLSDGTSSNVASFDFTNNTWSSVGKGAQIPGPVTACAVDNGNASSIFAAGISSDGSGPFIVFWNGQQWSRLDSSLVNGTSFSQLTVVPLQDTHSANGIIETDRVLLISGSLTSNEFGNASSAVFDGRNYIPYFVASSATGPGFVSQLFHSLTTFSFTQKHFLPVGLVILISIGISTAIIFLLLLIGILWTLFSRHEPETFASKYEPGDYDDDSLHRPSSLLAHINAATRSAIIGAGLESPLIGEVKGDEARSPTVNEHEQMPYTRAIDTPIDAAHGTLQNEGEDVARPAHIRYSFDGDGQGELRISSGAQVIILDDRDAAWWYARDPATGREGVIPASYLY